MELEERYAKLIDYLTDYIYTVRIQDGAAVETYHGPGCVAITGYTSDDYLANPDLWYSMVPRGDREKVLEQARRALAVGMRQFARTAGFWLIAEGVETPAELRTLREIDIHYIQGYLVGKPATAKALLSAARAQKVPVKRR